MAKKKNYLLFIPLLFVTLLVHAQEEPADNEESRAAKLDVRGEIALFVESEDLGDYCICSFMGESGELSFINPNLGVYGVNCIINIQMRRRPYYIIHSPDRMHENYRKMLDIKIVEHMDAEFLNYSIDENEHLIFRDKFGNDYDFGLGANHLGDLVFDDGNGGPNRALTQLKFSIDYVNADDYYFDEIAGDSMYRQVLTIVKIEKK